MTSSWNWRPHDYEGVWRYGPAWARPLVAAAPWITAGLALLMFLFAEKTLTVARGTDFALPEGKAAGEPVLEGAVAVLMPAPATDGTAASGTLVFFDDARYALSETSAAEALREHLSKARSETLLLLVDRRVSSEDMLRIVELARAVGIRRVQVAERTSQEKGG